MVTIFIFDGVTLQTSHMRCILCYVRCILLYMRCVLIYIICTASLIICGAFVVICGTFVIIATEQYRLIGEVIPTVLYRDRIIVFLSSLCLHSRWWVPARTLVPNASAKMLRRSREE